MGRSINFANYRTPTRDVRSFHRVPDVFLVARPRKWLGRTQEGPRVHELNLRWFSVVCSVYTPMPVTPHLSKQVLLRNNTPSSLLLFRIYVFPSFAHRVQLTRLSCPPRHPPSSVGHTKILSGPSRLPIDLSDIVR